MYKVLFIESGDYLYRSPNQSYFYSIFEVNKKANKSDYTVYVNKDKDELLDILQNKTYLLVEDENEIKISQNLNLFELVEEK